MTKRQRQVSYEDLSTRFNKPLSDVAVELGVCMTFLKKACRKHGIKRWPFRKVCDASSHHDRIMFVTLPSSRADRPPSARHSSLTTFRFLRSKRKSIAPRGKDYGRRSRLK